MAVELLERRLVLASSITVIAGDNGDGSLDSFLTASGGTVLAADGGAVPGTLSTAALASIPATNNINVTAQTSITFNDLGGTLTLPTAANKNVTFTATAGSLTFANTANTLATSGAPLTLKATTSATLAHLNSPNNIAIIADSVSIPQTITAGTGQVRIEPASAAQVVDLGGADAAGKLGLTDAELGRITAGVVRVGTLGNSGGIVISSSITRHAGYDTMTIITDGPITQTAPLSVAELAVQSSGADVTLANVSNDVDAIAGTADNVFSFTDVDGFVVTGVDIRAGIFLGSSDTVILRAGGAVTQTANQVIHSGGLRLLGAGPFTLNDDGNDIVTLAASLTGAVTGKLIYVDANDFSVGSVAGTNGVVTIDSSITLSATNGSITVTDTRNGADVNAGANFVQMTAGSSAGQDSTITVNANAGVTGTTSVFLIADHMTIGATINSGADDAIFRPFEAGTTISLGVADSPGTLGLTGSEINFVTADSLRVGSVPTGTINVNGAISPSNLNTLALENGAASINQSASGVLTVPNLRVRSDGSINLNKPNNVGTLAGFAGSSFTFNNGTHPLTVGVVDIASGITTASGIIDLIADNINIQKFINAQTQQVTLEPFTAGQVISLGGADAAGTLGLTDTEMNFVTANVLRIGTLANTGGITISSSITRHAGFITLTLITDGPITQTAPLSVARLAVQSSGADVALTDASNDVDSIAGTADNVFSFTDIDGFAVTGVDVRAGIFLGSTDTVTLKAGAAVTQTVNQVIHSGGLRLLGAGPFTLGDDGNDIVTLAASVTNNVTYVDVNSFTIGSVAGTLGVVSTAGTVNLSTTQGSITVTNTRDGADVSAGAQALLTSRSTAGQDSTITLNLNGGVTGTTGVTLTADNMVIGAVINAGANTVTLRPFESGTNVILGAADVANTLGLTGTEINFVTAARLRVGTNTTGPISVNAAISPSSTNTLALINGAANVNQAGLLTVANLRVTSDGAVNLNKANNVGTLAGSADSFVFSNGTNPLIVGIVDTATGIATTAGNVDLTANSLNIQQAVNAGTQQVTLQPFSAAQVIGLGSADAAGKLGLTDTEIGFVTANVLRVGTLSNTGGIAIGSSITRHAGFDTLTLITDGPITQTAALSVAELAVQSSGDNVTLTHAANDVDAIAGTADTLFNFTDTDGFVVSAVDVRAGIFLGSSDTITLTAGGAVTQTADQVINSGGLRLLGAGSYTLDDDGNNIVTLAANVSGGLTYVDSNALSIGAIVATVGVTATGPISITAAGPLTALSKVSGGAEITLRTADLASTGQNLTINTAVSVATTGAGKPIDLKAGDNLTLNGSLQVTATGQITLASDAGNADAGTGATIAFGPNFAVTSTLPLKLVGNTDSDTFNVFPLPTTPLAVIGGNPTPAMLPGDSLNVDLTGATNPQFSASQSPAGISGSWTFSNRAKLGFNTIETVTPDLVPPIGTWTAPGSPTKTAVDAVLIAFSEVVQNVSLSDFTLNGTNVSTLAGTTLTVHANNTQYIIHGLKNFDTASQTHTLAVAAGNDIEDTVGNNLSGTPSVSWVMDTVAPTGVWTAPASPTKTAVDAVLITFSEAVQNVKLSDFKLNGTLVSTLAGTSFTVHANSTQVILHGLKNFDTASQTHTLAVVAGNGIKDPAGNTLSGTPSVSWVMDTVAPTGVWTAPASPTKTAVDAVLITFSEAVQNVKLSDFKLNGTLVSTLAGTSFTVHANSTQVILHGLKNFDTASQTHTLAVVAGNGIKDPAGNGLSGTPSVSWVMDTVAPTGVWTGPASPTQTAVDAVLITFSEKMQNMALSNFTLNGTLVSTLAGTTITAHVNNTQFIIHGLSNFDAAPNTYTLAVVAGNGIKDVAGNGLSGTPSVSWTVTAAPPPPPPMAMTSSLDSVSAPAASSPALVNLPIAAEPSQQQSAVAHPESGDAAGASGTSRSAVVPSRSAPSTSSGPEQLDEFWVVAASHFAELLVV